MSRRVRLLLAIAVAFAFGLLAAWGKGPDTDGRSLISQIRSTLADLSTPWLLVAFIPGALSRRWWSGALLGLLATMSALLGFYLVTSLLVDLGGHGVAGDLWRELYANRIYLVSGVLSGPLFGALGAWWRTTRSLGASVVAGTLLMGEPIVLAVLGILIPATAVGRDGVSIAVSAAELGLGLLLVLVALRRPSAATGRTR